MRRSLLAGALLLALAACHKEMAKAPDGDAGGGPQIATSLDDTLPVDKSDQITAIDAATGDASGMPRDGGAVVVTPKPQSHPTVEAASGANEAVPVIAVPPPPSSAPTVAIPSGN